MSEHSTRDTHPWENLPPDKVLAAVTNELYHSVSFLSNRLNRLTDDDDPLTEDEYDAIFEQLQAAVRQLSKTVVSLKKYTQIQHPDIPPDQT